MWLEVIRSSIELLKKGIDGSREEQDNTVQHNEVFGHEYTRNRQRFVARKHAV